MSREPVELRFAYQMDDGRVEVHTGTYLFNTSTIADVIELAKCCENPPDWVEIDTGQDASCKSLTEDVGE